MNMKEALDQSYVRIIYDWCIYSVGIRIVRDQSHSQYVQNVQHLPTLAYMNETLLTMFFTVSQIAICMYVRTWLIRLEYKYKMENVIQPSVVPSYGYRRFVSLSTVLN